MLKADELVRVVTIWRVEVKPFTEAQIAFLETFADQAVIAIENVRLFQELEARNRELTESLEQQTATADILRVISSSPTDLQPVMDVVAESAARFCGAENATILRLEGEVLHLVAQHGPSPSNQRTGATFVVDRGGVTGRSVLDRRTQHIEDLSALPETEFPVTVDALQQSGVPVARTILVTPLLREGLPIGTIYMRRSEVQPFTEKQIALAKTFAAQAVIAIENVRLFTELEARNRELHRGARAADGDSRDPAGHLQLADRPPARVWTRRGPAARHDSAARGDVLDPFACDGEIPSTRGGSTGLMPGASSRSAGTVPPQAARQPAGGRAVRDRQPIHIQDLATVETEFPETRGTPACSGVPHVAPC